MMRKALLIATLAELASLTPGALAQWTERFDSYAAGSGLAGQGGWVAWCDIPEDDALVSNSYALSAPNSVEISGGADVVRQFPLPNPGAGWWTLTAYQYIPVEATGHGSFIMLNTYVCDLPNDLYSVNRSLVVKFYCEDGVVKSRSDGATRPLIKGQWVELRVEIDLDTDNVEFYYNGEILTRKSWTDGENGNGRLTIAGVDLFGDGCSPVYYDDLSLDAAPGACCDPWTGDCVDNVDAWNCVQQGFQPFPDHDCGELDPPCGHPGCCCDDETGEVSETLEYNCAGRFRVGVLGEDCLAGAFYPPCGMQGVLYAPAADDDPNFRNDLAQILLRNVDYFDARIGTPTLDELLSYDCVLTWLDIPNGAEYADPVGMGDVLADYVDLGLGGRVILGQGVCPSSYPDYLRGRIMTGTEYCPVNVSASAWGPPEVWLDIYPGNDCVYTGVGPYLSNCNEIPWLRTGPFAAADGVCSDGSLAVAYRLDRAVYYCNGHTGYSYIPLQMTGGWAELTANMCVCEGVPIHPTGDVNCDGVVNTFDIDPFVLALTDSAGYAAAYPQCDRDLADCNADGSVDTFDIDPFVSLVTGG